MKKQLLILLLSVLAAAEVSAQALTVKVKDSALRTGASIAVGMKFWKMEFDDKGLYTFSGDSLQEKTQAYLHFQDYGVYAVLEKGKPLVVEVSGTGRRMTAKFKGDNAYESELTSLLQTFYAPKNVYYEENNPKDTLSFPEAWKLLDKKYKSICSLLKKEKDAVRREKLQQEADLKYLDNCMEMQNGYCYKHKLDAKKDARLAELMAQVDPNDEKYRNYGILEAYILYKMPITVDENTDVTDYACEYVNTVSREISNVPLRNSVLDMFVGQGVQAEGIDIDKFWALVVDKCDAKTVSTYQFIVDAKKSTASGMKCPDVTFSDIDGKPCRLSDHFGRVLYIDIWATWCGPCCMEIPYVEKLVEHYKNDPRIEFVSISTDSNRKAWEEKVRKDKPQWAQYVTSAAENRELSKQWGVASIPRFLIINADGTICNNDAFRPSADDFIQRMDAILNAQKK